MPKIKVNSGARKRFRPKGNGKFKCRASNRNHILTKKTTKRKRHLRSGANYVDKSDSLSVARLLNLKK